MRLRAAPGILAVALGTGWAWLAYGEPDRLPRRFSVATIDVGGLEYRVERIDRVNSLGFCRASHQLMALPGRLDGEAAQNDPERAQELLGDAVDDADAPVSGGRWSTESGSPTGYIGCAVDDGMEVRVLLEAMASSVARTGEVGAGEPDQARSLVVRGEPIRPRSSSASASSGSTPSSRSRA